MSLTSTVQIVPAVQVVRVAPVVEAVVAVAKVGLGLRKELQSLISIKPKAIECLEITAEHFFWHQNDQVLSEVSRSFPIVLHGIGLSLGSPEQIDFKRLKELKRICELARPQWFSEHIAFTRVGGLNLGHLSPLPRTKKNLKLMIDKAKAVMDALARPLVLENITCYLNLYHEISETDFLNDLCHHSGCGLLVDITNMYVNSANLLQNPKKWLDSIDPKFVKQFHLVGYSEKDILYDSHDQNISDNLMQLAQYALEVLQPEIIIVERDANFPKNSEILNELTKIKELCLAVPRTLRQDQPQRPSSPAVFF